MHTRTHTHTHTHRDASFNVSRHSMQTTNKCLGRMDNIRDTAELPSGSDDHRLGSMAERSQGMDTCCWLCRWSFSFLPIHEDVVLCLGASVSRLSRRRGQRTCGCRCSRTPMWWTRSIHRRSTPCKQRVRQHADFSHFPRCLRYTDETEPTYINTPMISSCT